jgi:dephospho-CoA kinase
LRQAFGEDVFAHVIAKEVSDSTADLVVVEGIRRHQDYATLSRLPNFVLVAIDVSPKIRFARMKTRAQNPDEVEMTWEDFERISARTTEVSLLEVMQDATERLRNDGTVDELIASTENLLIRLKKSA